MKTSWKRYCEWYRHYPSVALSLDVSRMNFSAENFAALEPKFQLALSEMQKLEQGAIANPDEKRMVGHYWLRHPELAPNPQIQSEIEQTVLQIQDFAAQIHSAEIRSEKGKKFSRFLLVGIGGSALGPQLVADALGTSADALRPYFVDNTDPDGIQRTLATIGDALDETLVLIISKSGGTVETRNGQLEIARAFEKRGLNFANAAVAITSQGSLLDKLATEQRWLKRFPMWDWVGGRTSLFSAVGLVPAALQGLTIDRMLAGAHEMDEVTRESTADQNPAMLLAAMWYFAGNGRGEKDMVVLPYKDRLVLFSKYLQQLVMESLGKERDRNGEIVHQGIAVYGNKGSTDQHAYIQQLRDGVPNFFATFIQVLEDITSATPSQDQALEVASKTTSGDYLNGFYLGTREALSSNGRQSITISIARLDAFSLGTLIALFERAVGFYATFVNVNAYHQPGVEAGKKAAERVVALQQQLLSSTTTGPRTVEEYCHDLKAEGEEETIFSILEHLTHNGRARRTSDNRHPNQTRYEIAAVGRH